MNKELLRECFYYNDKQGGLKRKTGKKTGSKRPDGYINISVKGVIYLEHRLVWIYFNGDITEGYFIDHKNTIKSDNRIENLRPVTPLGSMKNLRRYKTNTSGATGVSWSKQAKKWKAEIQCDSKMIHLGYFDDFDDAVKVRLLKQEELGFDDNHGFDTR